METIKKDYMEIENYSKENQKKLFDGEHIKVMDLDNNVFEVAYCFHCNTVVTSGNLCEVNGNERCVCCEDLD